MTDDPIHNHPDMQWDMAVPDGWKLVPVEPTMEMIEAGRPRPPQWDKSETSKRIRLQCDEMRRKDWEAMLAAAPPPPQQDSKE